MASNAAPPKKRAAPSKSASKSGSVPPGAKPGPAQSNRGPETPFGAAPSWMADFPNLMQQLKVPGVDVEKLLALRRRDVEALVAANQEVYQSLQALARRQAELAQETMGHWQTAVFGGATGRPDALMGARAELAQEAFGRALSHLREMAELASQSQAKIFKLMQDRSAENLEEMQRLMRKG